jgi:DNA repair ATPase RecN
VGFDLHIRDFQSIEEANLRIEGFTVIYGTNNTGKTAAIRALRGVFSNTPGHRFVRQGKDKTVVKVVFDDGNEVLWEKGEKVSPLYVVNGKEISPGKAVPDEVLELGLKRINVGQRKLWPQFASQFGGRLFLLDQTGAVMAEAMADVERVGALNEALRLSERERKSTASTLKVRRQDRVQLERELEHFEALDEVDRKSKQLEVMHKKLTKGIRIAGWLQQLRAQMQAATRTVEQLSGVEDLEVPETKELEAQLRRLRRIQKLRRMYRAAEDQIARFEHVTELELPGVTELEKDLKKLEILRSTRDKIEKYKLEVKRYSPAKVIDFHETSEILAVVKGDFQRLGSLRALRERGNACKDVWKKATKELQELTVEYQEACDEVESILGDLQICPTCGSYIEEIGNEREGVCGAGCEADS